ncbi:hypothetical protein BGX38DRAFT_1138951 [Terfezia claveryi]|nr:hypothetical protein BGX38DRAFT_1138951 [Terfezia claveryi]
MPPPLLDPFLPRLLSGVVASVFLRRDPVPSTRAFRDPSLYVLCCSVAASETTCTAVANPIADGFCNQAREKLRRSRRVDDTRVVGMYWAALSPLEFATGTRTITRLDLQHTAAATKRRYSVRTICVAPQTPMRGRLWLRSVVSLNSNDTAVPTTPPIQQTVVEQYRAVCRAEDPEDHRDWSSSGAGK